MNPATKSLARTLACLLAAAMVSTFASGAFGADENPALVRIGDDVITSSDVDSLLAQAHRTMDIEKLAEEGALQRVLDKEIHDRLILADAAMVGIDQDPEVLAPVEKDREQRAARLMLRELMPKSFPVSEDSIQADFQRYYRKVTLRRLSVRGHDQAAFLRASILHGADMDSLARELSVDSHQARGGLIADVDWGDLEISLRDVVRDMKVGDVCAPFANNDAWTIVRLEGRKPADPDRLPELRTEIEGTLRAEAQRDRARAIVDSLAHVIPVQKDLKVLDSIATDADEVLRGSFRRAGEDPALWIDSEGSVTDHELRGIIAEAALANSSAPFDSLLAQSVRQARGDLLLRVAAERGGYLDRPVIRRAYESARRQAIITAYLKEFVADKIRFRHQDFEDFYQKHQDDFRGPDEVQMTVLIYDEQAEAQKVYDRLNDGEDFDYLRQETQPGWKASSSQVSKWAPVSSFSDEMQSTLEDLQVGDFSHPLQLGSQGWMILRLDGRRPGSVPPLKEVEMPIRQAIYRREFNSILDDVLAKLEKAIGVTRYDDRIRDYFQPSR